MSYKCEESYFAGTYIERTNGKDNYLSVVNNFSFFLLSYQPFNNSLVIILNLIKIIIINFYLYCIVLYFIIIIISYDMLVQYETVVV